MNGQNKISYSYGSTNSRYRINNDSCYYMGRKYNYIAIRNSQIHKDEETIDEN